MLSPLRLALVALGLLAFAWALTQLKPMPQAVLLAAGVAALVADRWAAPRARPVAFLLAASLAALVGFLVAGPELLARAERVLHPTATPGMATTALMAGGIVGAGLFVLTYLAVIRPTAARDRARRIGLVVIVVTMLVVSGLDALVL